MILEFSFSTGTSITVSTTKKEGAERLYKSENCEDCYKICYLLDEARMSYNRTLKTMVVTQNQASQYSTTYRRGAHKDIQVGCRVSGSQSLAGYVT